MIRTVVALLAATVSLPAIAQVPAGNSAPQPTQLPPPMPTPQDVAYPGTMTVDVDASDTRQGIFRVRQTIPVAKAGPMILLYPEWLPGNHSPTGQLEKMAGLVITADGKRVPWVRDTVDMYAFHVDVPAGARRLDLQFQFLSATESNQGRIMMTPSLVSVQPNTVSFYPAGYFTRRIPVRFSVRYPDGWSAASALSAKKTGSTYRYEDTNYEILVDSPMLGGKYYKSFELSPRVTLDAFADTPDQLAAKPDQIAAHQRLVDQAVKTFGAQHYDHYHFLVSISDKLGGIGLEHHRSSEDGTRPGYFTEWEKGVAARNLLPHEFTHSWDGKFRRGADLWTPNFDVPMRDSLLWVYEGQTQFWGYVLQARSGLATKEQMLDMLAGAVATYDRAQGREWRPMVDTTNDPIISKRAPKGWPSWQRQEDYYVEGSMVWMEVDATLREQSHGTKSIDDFARAFFGLRDGDWGELTYTFDDVVATLNGIQPYDWRTLLLSRLTETGRPAPTLGYLKNGYKLTYTAEQSAYSKQAEATRGVDTLDSLGLGVAKDGGIAQVIWGSPAYKAGLDNGYTIVAIGDDAYSGDALKAAITAAQGAKEPIRLTVKKDDKVTIVAIDYHGGLRYPHLVKVGTGETGLDKLLAPR